MTEYFVDTTAAPGGDGLSWGTAWDALRPNWASLPAGDHIINCRGGVDEGAPITTFPTAATSVTIRGDWGGFDVYEDCYRLRSTEYLTARIVIASKTLRFENIVVESALGAAVSSDAYALGAINNGTLEFINSVAIGRAGNVTPGTWFFVVRRQGTNSGIVAYNSIFTFDNTPQEVGNNARAASIVTTPALKIEIANCIFSNGAYTGATIAADGSLTNDSTVNFYNCVIFGTGSRATYTNCVADAYGGATNTDSLIRTKAEIEAYYVDAINGNFTPANLNQGPGDLVDQGVDRSAEIGSSLDILGNDRNDPAAGDAWDRGPYEWGFAGGPYPGEHIVTNTDNASDPNCIYFEQGVKIGDTFSFKETTEINGWGVSIDADGYPIIDSQGATGTDSFLFDIDRGSGFDDPSEWTFTIGGGTIGSNVIGGSFRTQVGAAGDGPANLEAFLASEGWGTTRAGENFTVRSGAHEWHFTWTEAQAGVYESMLPAPLRSDIDDGMGR